MEQKQVQEALARIDDILGKARIVNPVLNRQDHIQLTQDLQLVQRCCVEGLEAVKELAVIEAENKAKVS